MYRLFSETADKGYRETVHGSAMHTRNTEYVRSLLYTTMPANNFNFKNSYQFMGKYNKKNSYISEFSDKFLIFRVYSRVYKSYNKIASLYPLSAVSENTLYNSWWLNIMIIMPYILISIDLIYVFSYFYWEIPCHITNIVLEKSSVVSLGI